jgi:hypothetical protein
LHLYIQIKYGIEAQQKIVNSKCVLFFLYFKSARSFCLVRCHAASLERVIHFYTEYKTNHYAEQAVPQGELHFKEKSWTKYRFKVTPLARDTCVEANLYLFLAEIDVQRDS